MHGLYCAPDVGQEARIDSLQLSETFAEEFTDKTKSEMLTRHTGYSANGSEERHAVSQRSTAGVRLNN